MTPRKPSSPRHILLTVAGMTPATVSEAIYALAVARKTPLHQVRILTTKAAASPLRRDLAQVLSQMKAHYPKAGIPPKADIRVFRRPGKKLVEPDDIRTSEDNEQLADWILEQVFDACSDANTIVHASLAGGRKTMSFYLGAAMQLVGRHQDKLYHILVDSQYEVSGFHYPPPPRSAAAKLTLRDGSVLDISKARIDIATLPFVRLRGLLDIASDEYKSARFSFGNLMERAADALSDDYMDVYIDVNPIGGKESAHIRFGSKKSPAMKFQTNSSAGFLVYTWFLYRASQGEEPACLTNPQTFPEVSASFITWVRRAAPDSSMLGDLETLLTDEWPEAVEENKSSPQTNPIGTFLQKGWYEQFFSVWPSRLSKMIHDHFSKHHPASDPAKYLVKRTASATYGTPVPAEKIHLSIKKNRGAY